MSFWRRNRSACQTILIVVPLALLSLAIAGCKNSSDSGDADDKPTLQSSQKSPAQISVVNGESVITLDADTQTRLGITLASLASTASHAEQTFPATVLGTTDLAASHGNYLAAQSQLQKARVQAGAAAKEYNRLKSLYTEDQNISQKSLESAEADSQSAASDVTAAEQQVSLQKSLAAQQWGPVVADWTAANSSSLDRVLNQQDALVQVTLPGDASLTAPKSLTIENLDGTRTNANLVSAFPHVDSRVQGRSYLYIASPRSPIAPETSLLAHVAVGGSMKGFVVPASAVVWSEGKAWVYQQSGDTRFTRRAIATDVPIPGGYFVSTGFAANAKLVTVGAQALLSEEFLLRGAGTGTNND